MKRLCFFGFIFSSAIFIAVSAQNVEIMITTKIIISEDNAKDLMTLIHEDSKAFSKKYLDEIGVKSVETEVENKTLIKRLLSKK